MKRRQTLLHPGDEGVMVKIRVGVRNPVSLSKRWVPAALVLPSAPRRVVGRPRVGYTAAGVTRAKVQERSLRIGGTTASNRRSPWTVWAMGTSAGDGLNGSSVTVS